MQVPPGRRSSRLAFSLLAANTFGAATTRGSPDIQKAFVERAALISKESIADVKEPTLEGQPSFLACSVQDAIRAALELRKRIGKAKMNVMTKGQEFVRCVYGTTGSRVQVIVSYVC